MTLRGEVDVLRNKARERNVPAEIKKVAAVQTTEKGPLPSANTVGEEESSMWRHRYEHLASLLAETSKVTMIRCETQYSRGDEHGWCTWSQYVEDKNHFVQVVGGRTIGMDTHSLVNGARG